MHLIVKESNADMVTSPSGNFTVHRRSDFGICAGAFLALMLLVMSAAQAQTTNYKLGTTSLLEGPTAGSDSVVLAVMPETGSWTATPNATWLYLSSANQSGIGSTNVVFSFDANPGGTRSGTLTIGGQTLTVTQAGSTYVTAGTVTALVNSGLSQPNGVAVDGAGNVYISDFNNNAVYKWTPTNNTMTSLFSGMFQPDGLAVDSTGNVYVAVYGSGIVQKWTATNNTVTTLFGGLDHPEAVAVDGAGNLYVADSYNNAIKKWTVANNTVTTLVSSGLSMPAGVAVDFLGNVYIADYYNQAIKEWTAANNTVTTLEAIS